MSVHLLPLDETAGDVPAVTVVQVTFSNLGAVCSHLPCVLSSSVCALIFSCLLTQLHLL